MADRLQTLIDYYANLLIIQYNNKPKAKATMEALIKAVLSDDIFFKVRDGYSVETAIGAQLDIIGKYVDVDRFYTGQEFSNLFSFILYDEVDAPPSDRIGFAVYADFETIEGSWLSYAGTISEDFVLPDEDFRKLIKLRIIQNNSNHSHAEIDKAVHDAFGSFLQPDSANNMQMDYFLSGELSPVATVAKQKNVLPRPAGVQLRYFIEDSDLRFGFATYSDDGSEKLTGFANYSDYDTKDGDILRYLKLEEA